MELFNLLLVDDEPYILDGLRYNIDWRELGIAEVYTADSTQAALSVLKNHRIDVVIADIQMPGDDGLVLGGHIFARYPYTKVIILSGYQNFSYAQRSVDIKVFKYLLKPIQYEELEEAVAQALAELNEELMKEASLQAARAGMEEAAPILQKHFLDRWLEKGATFPNQNGVDVKKYGLDVEEDDYGFLVMLCVEQSVLQEEETHRVALELCQSILAENSRMTGYLSSQGTHSFFFFQKDGPELRQFFHRVIERLEIFMSALESSIATPGPIRIFWSAVHPLQELGGAYRELNRKFFHYLGSSHNVICSAETEEDPSAAVELKTLNRQPPLATLVAGCQREAAAQWIDAVFEELMGKEQNCYEQYLQIYHLIIGTVISDSVQRRIGISEWSRGFSEFMRNMGTTVTEELHSKCAALVEQYIGYLIGWQGSHEKRLVKNIRQVVSQYLSQPVSVSFLAAQLSYNPTYLSRVFKDETGLSLQDYITQVKMDHAKDLLRQGRPAGDAAREVGYENYPHFSRVFKKVVGLSPKNYQEMG